MKVVPLEGTTLTVPELVEVGTRSFFADGIYLGTPRIHRGRSGANEQTKSKFFSAAFAPKRSIHFSTLSITSKEAFSN